LDLILGDVFSVGSRGLLTRAGAVDDLIALATGGYFVDGSLVPEPPELVEPTLLFMATDDFTAGGFEDRF